MAGWAVALGVLWVVVLAVASRVPAASFPNPLSGAGPEAWSVAVIVQVVAVAAPGIAAVPSVVVSGPDLWNRQAFQAPFHPPLR